MSVWNFSTPSMGTQVTNERETNDVQDALCCFNMPTMPRLFDTSGAIVNAEELQHASEHSDSPRPRGRGISIEQKQASNREHQRRFRERSKVIRLL